MHQPSFKHLTTRISYLAWPCTVLESLSACTVWMPLGEVSALLPVTGSFVRHAEFLVDPSMGFALGWNIVYGNWLSIPAEISAQCVLFSFWTDVSPAVWVVLFVGLASTL